MSPDLARLHVSVERDRRRPRDAAEFEKVLGEVQVLNGRKRIRGMRLRRNEVGFKRDVRQYE